MNRLWVRLILAFALVILVTVGAIALLAGLTADQEFRRYLTYSDASPDRALLQQLVSFYQVHGNWEGVAVLLEREGAVPGPGTSFRQGREGPLRFVLADASGRVVYDGVDHRTDRQLSPEEQAAAQAVTVDGETIGQLVAVIQTPPPFLGPLEQVFVARLRWWLAVGAVLAGGLGLLLGLLLSRSLTAPLRRLADAAHAVAARDFSRRVKEEGGAELVEVAQSFNQMTVALEESERQRRNMVADVAHELRTPLSVLQGNLQAILDDVYSLDKVEISRLYDETRLLSRLVDDLRELALADAGQLRLNLLPVAAVAVVQNTVDSLALVAEAEEVALSVQVPGDLPPVQADPDRLSQVLRNLLLNALRHTPAGGAVTITATSVPQAVEIAVVDTGEGIAPEDLPHVFERFWRGDRSRSRDKRWPGSTGLGLSVTRSLVEAHGGTIRVESTPGQGSTFRFTLPLAQPAGDARTIVGR
jgi:two-component system OmpR family sensor kinase/two-component system sensor histidine kinase BaeS